MEPLSQMSATYDGTLLDALLDMAAYRDWCFRISMSDIADPDASVTCNVDRTDGAGSPVTFAVMYDSSAIQPQIEHSCHDGSEIYTLRLGLMRAYGLGQNTPVEASHEGKTFRLKVRD